MPQHNMESPRSPWQQGLRPPWITRVTGGQSPASSGAESDTESSSTESERSCIKMLEMGLLRVSSPSMLRQRITEIDQQKEELKIELQLEIALLQGELQTEKSQLHRHTQKLQTLQREARQKKKKQRHIDRQKERESLEEERRRLEELKGRCEAKEKLIPKMMEAAVRAFEDWEFRVLEQESAVDEEEESAVEEEEGESAGHMENEISRQQHGINIAQDRVQQLERQLREMEREKEKELNALRKERRDLVLTSQTVPKEKKPLNDWSNITGSAPCMMSFSPLTVNKPPQKTELTSQQQMLVRTLPDSQSPEAFTSPLPSHRLSNGHRNGTSNGGGLLSPCSSATSSRAASPSLLDLVEIEKKLREAKAERERLLRERSLGHGVTSCTDLRLTPRRCAGFLTKRGGRVKTWKKRWFLFDMDHKRLAYYAVSAAQSDVLREDIRPSLLSGGIQSSINADLDGCHCHCNRRAQPLLTSCIHDCATLE
ncbi:hypothetical protein FQN60_017195 [Etheostoma spectabile]|uniref:PH domain-containing protein n=1 Tax=Etheostoma spectabile TaxID=54343 RepID=A0A5J5DES5_9PERO|nr:hypothetical protein FQN60_017195 [Etheostoma spectabile]